MKNLLFFTIFLGILMSSCATTNEVVSDDVYQYNDHSALLPDSDGIMPEASFAGHAVSEQTKSTFYNPEDLDYYTLSNGGFYSSVFAYSHMNNFGHYYIWGPQPPMIPHPGIYYWNGVTDPFMPCYAYNFGSPLWNSPWMNPMCGFNNMWGYNMWGYNNYWGYNNMWGYPNQMAHWNGFYNSPFTYGNFFNPNFNNAHLNTGYQGPRPNMSFGQNPNTMNIGKGNVSPTAGSTQPGNQARTSDYATRRSNNAVSSRPAAQHATRYREASHGTGARTSNARPSESSRPSTSSGTRPSNSSYSNRPSGTPSGQARTSSSRPSSASGNARPSSSSPTRPSSTGPSPRTSSSTPSSTPRASSTTPSSSSSGSSRGGSGAPSRGGRP